MDKRVSREKILFIHEKTTANIDVNPTAITSAEDINQLKAQMLDMQMEMDILKETINVLKKIPASIRQLSRIERRQ